MKTGEKIVFSVEATKTEGLGFDIDLVVRGGDEHELVDIRDILYACFSGLSNQSTIVIRQLEVNDAVPIEE